jgi:carbonic anhydrase/acetyltransferase-like protein (isoleucine patch superfamily)
VGARISRIDQQRPGWAREAARLLVDRSGDTPDVSSEARVAATACVIGNVHIGAGAYVDHGVVIESSGAPISIGPAALVFAGAVVRSVGGASRPAFPVEIGPRTLVSPGCVLTGCRVGRNCYIATGAIVLQGASLGDHVRVGVGAIVHATTALPDHARVGMRHVVVPTANGFLSTASIEQAREAIAELDFFETAFGASAADQASLHEQVMTTLLEEVHLWRDEPLS